MLLYKSLLAPLLLKITPKVIPVNRYDVSFDGAESW